MAELEIVLETESDPVLDAELVALELAVSDMVELAELDAVLDTETDSDVVCVLVPVIDPEVDTVELPVSDADVLPEDVPVVVAELVAEEDSVLVWVLDGEVMSHLWKVPFRTPSMMSFKSLANLSQLFKIVICWNGHAQLYVSAGNLEISPTPATSPVATDSHCV